MCSTAQRGLIDREIYSARPYLEYLRNGVSQ